MRDDEKLMFQKMLDLTYGQDVGLASNAAMKVAQTLRYERHP
jgi:hypothetical protein